MSDDWEFGLESEERRRILAPRPGWSREEWMPVPALGYVNEQPAAASTSFLKGFLRWYMGVVAQASVPAQFVLLLRLRTVSTGVDVTLIAPYADPFDRMREAMARGVGARELGPELGDLPISYRLQVPPDLRVPVVVTCNGAANEFAFDNLNHIGDPRQFLKPALCRTTSGFLNFLGAQDLGGNDTTMVSDSAELREAGLGEFMRWVLCVMETGLLFEQERLLVRCDQPEEWVYDYDG